MRLIKLIKRRQQMIQTFNQYFSYFTLLYNKNSSLIIQKKPICQGRNTIMSNQLRHESKGKFKIAHSLQQLEDQLILTLKDQPLLKNNKEVNEDEDLFENEQLQTMNRMKHNAELRKKVKELSDVSTSHLLTKQQGTGGILPHYDDHSYQTQEIQIQTNGIIKSNKPKAFRNTQSDFLTQQETQTQKLGAQYNTIRIKKSAKKNSGQRQYNTSDLLGFLDQTAQDTINQDQGKRSADVAIEEALDSIRKKRITQFNAKRQVESVDISSIIGVNEEEEILNKAILNAQRRKHQKKNFILDSIKEDHDEDEEHRQNSNKKGTVEIQLNPISYRGEDKKYVRKDFDVGGIKSGTTSAMFIKLPSQRLVKKQQNQMPESFKDLTPEELEKMREQVSFLEDRAVGTGLAGTLQFLRQNSLINQEEQVGRNTDRSSTNINDPNDRVKLQYRNSNGQLMKPKEAFRYLCATFHGQGPGKNKIEQRKRKQLLQLQMKERQNTDGQLLNLLSEHQRKSNEAFMVIDFGKKAGSKNS